MFATFTKHYANGTIRTQKYFQNWALSLCPLLTPKLGTCPYFAYRKFGRLNKPCRQIVLTHFLFDRKPKKLVCPNWRKLVTIVTRPQQIIENLRNSFMV